MTPPDAAKITVIIPVRNGENFLDQAIRSVLSQSSADIRLVISDNGSTDTTPQIARSFSEDPRVTVVRREGDLGMIEHFNLCLTEVQTEYHMLLCHDDMLASSDALEVALRVAEDHAQISAVYSDLEYVDAASRRISLRKFHRSGEVDGLGIARAAIVSNRNLYGIPLLVRTASRAGHLYDVKMPYVADVEMAAFLSTKGPAWYISRALVANRYHGKNSTRGLMRNTRSELLGVAGRYGIRIGVIERALSAASSIYVAAAKLVFFSMLTWRERRATGR